MINEQPFCLAEYMQYRRGEVNNNSYTEKIRFTFHEIFHHFYSIMIEMVLCSFAQLHHDIKRSIVHYISNLNNKLSLSSSVCERTFTSEFRRVLQYSATFISIN